MIDRFELFTNTISEITHYWNRIATVEMEKYSLKGLYALYIVTLYRNPDGITATELCEISNKDKAEISRAVSILEKKGLVMRQKVTSNAYRALLKLTDEGVALAEILCGRVNVIVEGASNGVSKEDLETFYRVIGTIAGNLKTISREGTIK